MSPGGFFRLSEELLKKIKNKGAAEPSKEPKNEIEEIDDIDESDLDKFLNLDNENYGGGASDSIEDFGKEEDDAKKKELEEQQRQEEKQRQEEERNLNIDKEIDALLAQDLSVKGRDLNFDLIQNVDIHENRDDYQAFITDADSKEKAAEKVKAAIDGMSMKAMYIMAGALLILILIMAAVGFLINTLENNARQKDIQSKHLLTQPAYVSNNANFIYLNRLADFKDEELVLVKMLIDSAGTLFYFQQNLNVSNLDFLLEDENGAIYGMDLTYEEYGRDEQESGSVIRFEPIDLSVRNYVLNISDGKQSCQFPFELDRGMVMPPIKYLTVPQDALVNVPGLYMTVEGGTLSSSGSVIHFKLKWDDPSLTVQMGNRNNTDVMGMTESGRTVLPAKSKPLLYEFAEDDSVLGRMDFQAVKSLSGILRVTFRNLYKKFKVNAELPTEGLFTNTPEGQQIYAVGDYDVVLERMGWQGDEIVLVFHTKIRNFFAKSGENVESRYIDRVECQLDAQLVVKTASGMEITLEGNSVSGQRGTDMRFNTAMAKGFMQNNLQNDITLKIDSVLIKMDTVTAEYDLDKARLSQSAVTQKALSNIEDSFRSRLSYKSGELAAREITGFAEEVLADERLMSSYEPVANAASASYTAQFVTYSINDNDLQGVVQELWKATVDGRESRFYRTHRIWAESSHLGWQIIKDEIIR